MIVVVARTTSITQATPADKRRGAAHAGSRWTQSSRSGVVPPFSIAASYRDCTDAVNSRILRATHHSSKGLSLECGDLSPLFYGLKSGDKSPHSRDRFGKPTHDATFDRLDYLVNTCTLYCWV